MVRMLVARSAEPDDVEPAIGRVRVMMRVKRFAALTAFGLARSRRRKIAPLEGSVDSLAGSCSVGVKCFVFRDALAVDLTTALAPPICATTLACVFDVSIVISALLGAGVLRICSALFTSSPIDLFAFFGVTLARAFGIASLAESRVPSARFRKELGRLFGMAASACPRFRRCFAGNKNGRPDFFGPAMGAVSFEHVS